MTSERSLFRQEAVEFQQNRRQWGDLVLLQPVSSKVLTWFLVIVVAAAGVFLCTADYARKETVVGYLTPTQGTAKVYVPQPGVIKQVHVTEGQVVEDGAPLLTIATPQISGSDQDVNATILGTLESQRALLSKQMDDEQRRTHSERDRLTSLIRGLEAEISQIKSQAAVQGERIQLTGTLVSTASELNAKGIMAQPELKRRQEAVLEQRQTLAALNQQVAARQNQLTELRFALEQLPTLMEQKVQALRNDVAATEQKIAEINGRRGYVVRAPTKGRVTTLQATPGQAADLRRLQLEIVPLDAVLHAQLFIPAKAAGFVRPGQAIRVLYDAFPYQNFGAYGGRIASVSETLLTSTDAAGPVALKEPAYRARAELDRPDIDAYGKKLALQPDMLLKADILLEKRSLARWLLSPLLSARL